MNLRTTWTFSVLMLLTCIVASGCTRTFKNSDKPWITQSQADSLEVGCFVATNDKDENSLVVKIVTDKGGLKNFITSMDGQMGSRPIRYGSQPAIVEIVACPDSSIKKSKWWNTFIGYRHLDHLNP